MPRKLLVGGNQKTGTLKSIKKVAPPIAPGTINRSVLPPFDNQTSSQPVGEAEYEGVCTNINSEDSLRKDVPANATLSAADSQMEDQGIEIEVSPGRESPGGSSVGCLSRHSTASMDSGRSSITYPEIKSTLPRLSAHSSESSQVFNINIEDSINVSEMLAHNLPENEILKSWLSSVHFEEYVPLFIQAGYDMPTVSRMTPEDLTAVGITKPMHRRNLKAEIAKLNISDGIPDFKPNTLLEWLQLLRLEEYHDTLCQQGYDTVDRVTELAWEDLEEIGIQKLGHQKKIMLAIKRIQDINSGVRKPNLNTVSEFIGKGTLSRPQTLGPVNPISTLQCHSQEIAITTVKVKTSPSSEISSIPEFKTFQYSPVKGETFRWPGNGESLSPANAVNNFEAQMVDIQVQSPNRRHSLENLDKSDTISSSHHSYINNTSDSWYDTVSAWRHHGYDTDSELSIHGEHCYLYEAEGTATLQRLKGLVKPRPVAKIIAKSRQSNQINDSETLKHVKYNEQKADQVSVESSQQTSVIPAGYGTLKYKKTPPPPPKRSNSIKSDPSIERTIEAMKDEAFATCVKGLASHFNIATKNNDVSSNSNQPKIIHGSSEEFPPPPSPLPLSVIEVDSKPSVTVNSYNESEQKEIPELFSNAMFKQRRKHSLDSTVSVSGSESNTLPFANENVSTIKQKINKPQVSENKSPSPSILRKTNLTLPGNKTITAKRRNSNGGERSEESTFARKVTASSEDVIDDIEHMLTNLSNQLDAMLEDEKLMKDDQ